MHDDKIEKVQSDSDVRQSMALQERQWNSKSEDELKQ
jgi:hypothetical protein